MRNARFGEALKKLKGLWFLGGGLFILFSWVFLGFFLLNGLVGDTISKNVFVVFQVSLSQNFESFSRPSPWLLWPITGFALVAIGVFRLVVSLLPEGSSDD